MIRNLSNKPDYFSRESHAYAYKQDQLRKANNLIKREREVESAGAQSWLASQARKKAELEDTQSEELAIDEANRMAGDKITPEFLQSIYKVADEMEAEELRQYGVLEAIHGKKELAAYLDPSNPAQTVEQQLSKSLLYGDITDMPTVLGDRVLGKDVTTKKLGIDGEYKDDSEIRRHVKASLDEDGTLNVKRGKARTEFLSEAGADQVYSDWKKMMQDENYRTDKNRSVNRGVFNTLASEYYGQQALKLNNYKPVADSDRSEAIRLDRYRDWQTPADPNSTIGTDRLIENSRQLSMPDIDESADFRAINPKGDIAVMDYQTGMTGPNLKLNLFKGADLSEVETRDLNRNMQEAAQVLKSNNIQPDLDNIFNYLMETGKFPRLQKSTAKPNSGKARAGKFLADGKYMGRKNKGQYRHEGVLYGLGERGHLDNKLGMVPQDLAYVDSSEVRQYFGDQLLSGRNIPIRGGRRKEGATRAPDLSVLYNRDHVKDFLEPDLIQQITTPYSF